MCVFATALLVVMASARAEQPQNGGNRENPLAAEIDVKVAAKRGNTDIASGDLKVTLAKDLAPWRLSFLTEADGTSSDNEVISESFLLDAMASRRIGTRLGIVFELDAYKDRFAGIDWRTTAGAGIAWSTMAGARWDIHAMGGLGWQQETPVEPEIDRRAYGIGALQARGVWRFADNSTFRQVLYFAPEIRALDRYLLYLRLTWRTRTNRWLAVEIDYVLRHDSDPIATAEATDQAIMAGFVFTFGPTAAALIDGLLLPPS